MFKIYIDYDRMYNICLEQDDSDTWYKILCKQQCININHAVDDEEFYNEDNPLLLFSQMNGVEFNDASSYINDVINDNTKVLEQPCGAFILNIDSAKASEIQKRFGVICQSTEEKNAKPLTIGDITITTTTPGTWAKRMPLGKVLPSNTLILIDRYLFGSENDETLQDSYDNILDMMNAFMPETFDSEYHICIIFDTDHIQDRDIKILLGSDKSRDFDEEDRKKAFAKISTNINRIKKDFVKKHGYPITLEILSCDRRDRKSYEKTHDRRIISNYFFATASHKLKAFRNGKPIQKQKIDLLSLYAKGLSDLSDIPEYAHADDIKDLRYIMQEAKNHPILHMYSINGNANSLILNAKNRILV